LNNLISNVNVNQQTNPTLYNQIQTLKQQISNYQNGNGTLPVVTPALAQSIVQNVSVNPQTNPSLYQYVQYIQNELSTIYY